MENPFAKITQKDWLYIAGAVASLIALGFLFHKGGVSVNSGTVSDTPNTQLPEGTAVAPGYTTYNTGPIIPEPLPGTAPGDTAAGTNGSCSCSSYGCAGVSQLDTGDANTSLGQYLAFLQNTNPAVLSAWAAQMRPYSGYVSLKADPVPLSNN